MICLSNVLTLGVPGRSCSSGALGTLGLISIFLSRYYIQKISILFFFRFRFYQFNFDNNKTVTSEIRFIGVVMHS